MNDSKRCLSSIAQRIHQDLGAEIPWHVSAYHPAFQANQHGLTKSTPRSTLETAHTLGKKSGLNHVYIGNVLGHPAEHSYCKACSSILIRRVGYDIANIHLKPNGSIQAAAPLPCFESVGAIFTDNRPDVG